MVPIFRAAVVPAASLCGDTCASCKAPLFALFIIIKRLLANNITFCNNLRNNKKFLRRIKVAEKISGELTFDVNSGSFWITQNEAPVTQLGFGDSFEVKDQNGNWVQSAIEISSDAENNLVFKHIFI